MDSKKIILKYIESQKGYIKKRAIEKILNKEIWQYEEEFGSSVARFTEENIRDIIILKLESWRTRTILDTTNVYEGFYTFCYKSGFRDNNPFEMSARLNKDYLLRYAVENLDIPIYSKHDIVKACNSSILPSYTKAIALSIFEGIRDLKELANITMEIVDLNNNVIHLPDRDFYFSNDLKEYYSEVRRLDKETFGKRTIVFYPELLIKSTSANQLAAVNKRYAARLAEANLGVRDIYDSGLINYLISELGYEGTIEKLEMKAFNKGIVVENNKELEVLLKKYGCEVEPKELRFDFAPYVVKMKYKK